MKMVEDVDLEMESDGDEASSGYEEMSDVDSDEELQKALASGKIKPGSLVVMKSGEVGEKEKPRAINNVAMLKLKLEQIKYPKKLAWLERLDVVNEEAPLAPEIALQLDEHKGKRSREIKMINNQRKKKSVAAAQPKLKSVEEDPVHNDFVREMSFYRQAQQAVLTCLPRLKEMGVPTKRPDDYFAEMAKSDSHMQKVAQVLLKKQTSTERAEKVRKLREQKKFAKQTQVHVLQERQKAKKDMLENIKKIRKGQKNNLDFLDEKKQSGKGKRDAGRGTEKRVNRRRLIKNDKYGYGGKKKGAKWNTRDSLDTFDDGSGGKGGRGKGGRGGSGPGMRKGRPGLGGGKSGPSKRPGKQNRQKMKAKGK